MDLFIDTPQRALERMERERQIHLEHQNMDGDERVGAGGWHADDGASRIEGGGPRQQRDRRRSDGGVHANGTALNGDRLNVPAAEAYRAELAYDRRRARRRKFVHALKMLAVAVFVPLAVVAVFFASYALTYILNGASPEEVMDALRELMGRIGVYIQEVISSSSR